MDEFWFSRVQEFLKYTPETHPDYMTSHQALEKIEWLAQQMDKCNLDQKNRSKELDRLEGIQATIDGLTGLTDPPCTRKFIRQDLVAEKLPTAQVSVWGQVVIPVS